MKLSAVFALVAFFAGVSEAFYLPVSRQSSECTCGNTSYNSSDITGGIAAAETGVIRGYPHQYHDYEGFSFPNCSGNFYEFPLKSGSVYEGGSPGADRVIYDGSSGFCGCITHIGAHGNKFVQCDSKIQHEEKSSFVLNPSQ